MKTNCMNLYASFPTAIDAIFENAYAEVEKIEMSQNDQGLLQIHFGSINRGLKLLYEAQKNILEDAMHGRYIGPGEVKISQGIKEDYASIDDTYNRLGSDFNYVAGSLLSDGKEKTEDQAV